MYLGGLLIAKYFLVLIQEYLRLIESDQRMLKIMLKFYFISASSRSFEGDERMLVSKSRRSSDRSSHKENSGKSRGRKTSSLRMKNFKYEDEKTNNLKRKQNLKFSAEKTIV